MKTVKTTRKQLHAALADKYGSYAVNDFLKRSLELALKNKDYFFDVLTGVHEAKYFDEQVRSLDRQ